MLQWLFTGVSNSPRNETENVAMQNSTLGIIYLRLESIYLDAFSHLISFLYVNYFVND